MRAKRHSLVTFGPKKAFKSPVEVCPSSGILAYTAFLSKILRQRHTSLPMAAETAVFMT